MFVYIGGERWSVGLRKCIVWAGDWDEIHQSWNHCTISKFIILRFRLLSINIIIYFRIVSVDDEWLWFFFFSDRCNRRDKNKTINTLRPSTHITLKRWVPPPTKIIYKYDCVWCMPRFRYRQSVLCFNVTQFIWIAIFRNRSSSKSQFRVMPAVLFPFVCTALYYLW